MKRIIILVVLGIIVVVAGVAAALTFLDPPPVSPSQRMKLLAMMVSGLIALVRVVTNQGGSRPARYELVYKDILEGLFERDTGTRRRLLQALALYNANQNIKAYRQLKKLLDCDINDAEKAVIWLFMGNCANDDGEQELALHCYEQATALSPGLHSAWVNLANALSHKGEFGRAEEAIRRMMKLKPGDALAYAALATLYVKQMRLDEAIPQALKAIEINPGYAEAYSTLALAYGYMGNQQSSEEHLRKAVALGYKDAEAIRRMIKDMWEEDSEDEDADRA